MAKQPKRTGRKSKKPAAPKPRALPGGGPATRSAPSTRGAVRARSHGDTVAVTFELTDVARELISDSDTRFTFRTVSGHQFCDQVSMAPLRATPTRFTIPASQGEAVVCEIDPYRYRFARSPIFFRPPGAEISRPIVLFREPDAWAPAFVPWADLKKPFHELTAVLSVTGPVQVLRRGLPGGGGIPDVVPSLAKHAYDDVPATLDTAKMALLNTHHMLRVTNEPISGSRSWFSFVRTIVAIGRERFLAYVEPEMETLVRFISDNISDFGAEYERTPAENHRGNVPAELQSRITGMVSIKSSHARGNFQLTLTHLAGAGGKADDVLLDADIDESGTVLGHILDVLKHKRTGGTSPIEIHEILTYLHYERIHPGALDLGYMLRPSS